jgi:hypothetical protein
MGNVVNECVFDGNTFNGVTIVGGIGTPGFPGSSCTNCTFTGNKFDGTVEFGLSGLCDDVVVTGNIFMSTVGLAVTTGGGLAPSADRMVFSSNKVIGVLSVLPAAVDAVIESNQLDGGVAFPSGPTSSLCVGNRGPAGLGTLLNGNNATTFAGTAGPLVGGTFTVPGGSVPEILSGTTRIMMSRSTIGAGALGNLGISAQVVGGFTILSDAVTDVSTVNYTVFGESTVVLPNSRGNTPL